MLSAVKHSVGMGLWVLTECSRVQCGDEFMGID